IEQLQSNLDKNAAFKELISLYKERLYWHIRHIVKSHDDTDDVLQNTFIKIYKNIQKFKGDSKLYSWMYRIATNEALTSIKKRANEFQISDEEAHQLAIADLKEHIYFERNDIQLKVQEAIAPLPEKHRHLLNRKYLQVIQYKDMRQIFHPRQAALEAS